MNGIVVGCTGSSTSVNVNVFPFVSSNRLACSWCKFVHVIHASSKNKIVYCKFSLKQIFNEMTGHLPSYIKTEILILNTFTVSE